jgi:hypothetical protein
MSQAARDVHPGVLPIMGILYQTPSFIPLWCVFGKLTMNPDPAWQLRYDHAIRTTSIPGYLFFVRSWLLYVHKRLRIETRRRPRIHIYIYIYCKLIHNHTKQSIGKVSFNVHTGRAPWHKPVSTAMLLRWFFIMGGNSWKHEWLNQILFLLFSFLLIMLQFLLRCFQSSWQQKIRRWYLIK